MTHYDFQNGLRKAPFVTWKLLHVIYSFFKQYPVYHLAHYNTEVSCFLVVFFSGESVKLKEDLCALLKLFCVVSIWEVMC